MSALARIRRAAPFAVVLAASLLATSCGGGTGSVKGTITVGGKPLPSGLIVFLPEGGNKDPMNCAIRNGEYETTPMPAGLARIYIIPSSRRPQAEGGSDLVPAVREAANDPFTVPTKYQTVETSGLTVTVKAGETLTFDKDLTP
jgi:hypothetical protein